MKRYQRPTKCIIILSLCLLIEGCPDHDPDLEERIDIGDYEDQLSAWNGQNMLDYQLSVVNRISGPRFYAVINVKEGIPESSDPPSWLEKQKLSTIPEFYLYIKEVEKEKRDRPKDYKRSSFKVRYNVEYHYPNYTFDYYSHGSELGAWAANEWFVTLTPLGENEQETGSGEK
jgi:hypothetical protein